MSAPPKANETKTAVAAGDGLVDVRFLKGLASEAHNYRANDVAKLPRTEALRYATAGIVALIPAAQATETR